MAIRGRVVVFEKDIANALIKRGFPLLEIGGNAHSIYYFDESEDLYEAITKIREEIKNNGNGNI